MPRISSIRLRSDLAVASVGRSTMLCLDPFPTVRETGAQLILAGIMPAYPVTSSLFAGESASKAVARLMRECLHGAVVPAPIDGFLLRSSAFDFTSAAYIADAAHRLTIDVIAPPDPLGAALIKLRVQRWLDELGSDDDSGSVELVEIDGIEFGLNFGAFWYAFLGDRVEGRRADDNSRTLSLDGMEIRIWGIRIYCDDTDSYGEIRYPPWGTGDLDLRQIDPFRPAAALRIRGGLRALGYGRRKGRRSLEDLWTQDEFHGEYLGAEEVVRARRPGKHPSQVEVAGEMSMSERHLRRLVELYGLPGEKRS